MNNFKNFLKEKKDLLIFLGVLIVTFISVLTIASFTLDSDEGAGGIVDDTPKTPIDNTPTEEVKPKSKFSLPLKENYVISREFFDLDSDIETLSMAVMSNGKTFVESKGVSFSTTDNKVFNVYNVLPGEVISVDDDTDTLAGYTIAIKHDNGVVSTYSSLSSVNVSVGDILNESGIIGVSGTNVNDIDAKIHVHLTVTVNGTYINPKEALGKEATEIVSSMK
jgi:stage II sporulation protein Q